MKNINTIKSDRKSNIELLRIFAMVMIIAHHIAVHSNFNFPTNLISINRLWIQLIQMGGKIGVDIFVLISGYFLIMSSSIKTSKVLKLWLQIFTYSAGIFFVFTLLSSQGFGIKALVENVLPITFSKWWFASTYFMLYLISPYINKLLRLFDKKEYQRFLVLLFVSWCVVPTFLGKSWQSNSLLWFVFLYALAGYIRLHIDCASISNGKCILIAIVTTALTFLSVIAFDLLGLKIGFIATHATFFYGMEKLPILVISLMLFLGFANMKMGYVPLINTISSACFGIYLLHDNSYIRALLWSTIFKNSNYEQSSFLVPYTLMQIVVVFVVCAVVELIRIHLVEKKYSKLIDKLSNLINKIIDKLFSCKVFEKF